MGSGVKLQSGTLAVWNAGRGQSRWELPTAVWDTVSSLLTHTHTQSHTPSPHPSPGTKAWGPSCVTKMKQAQTTLSEPSTMLPLLLLPPLPAGERRILKVRELPEAVKHPLQCTGSGHPACVRQLQAPQGYQTTGSYGAEEEEEEE